MIFFFLFRLSSTLVLMIHVLGISRIVACPCKLPTSDRCRENVKSRKRKIDSSCLGKLRVYTRLLTHVLGEFCIWKLIVLRLVSRVNRFQKKRYTKFKLNTVGRFDYNTRNAGVVSVRWPATTRENNEKCARTIYEFVITDIFAYERDDICVPVYNSWYEFFIRCIAWTLPTQRRCRARGDTGYYVNLGAIKIISRTYVLT